MHDCLVLPPSTAVPVGHDGLEEALYGGEDLSSLSGWGSPCEGYCWETGVHPQFILNLNKAINILLHGTTPARKGSGRPRKTTPCTDALLKREIMLQPSYFLGIKALWCPERDKVCALSDIGCKKIWGCHVRGLANSLSRVCVNFTLNSVNSTWIRPRLSGGTCLVMDQHFVIRNVSKLAHCWIKMVKYPPRSWFGRCFIGNGGPGGLYFLSKGGWEDVLKSSMRYSSLSTMFKVSATLCITEPPATAAWNSYFGVAR